jgi:hypothetical protein
LTEEGSRKAPFFFVWEIMESVAQGAPDDSSRSHGHPAVSLLLHIAARRCKAGICAISPDAARIDESVAMPMCCVTDSVRGFHYAACGMPFCMTCALTD